MISEFSSEAIYNYLDNYIRTTKNYGQYKIKEVVILKIEQIIGFEIIVVDYKVSLYKSGFGFVGYNDPFTPNTQTVHCFQYSWVEGTISLDLADPQIRRDLVLNEIID
jgi:hypothetical protein